jgi:Fe-S cluster assembly protein SufD
MQFISFLKIGLFFSINKKMSICETIKNKSSFNNVCNIKRRKKSKNNVMLQKNNHSEKSNWVENVVLSKKSSKYKLINDFNKAGCGLLKTIPLPSSSEESYRFTLLDKLFEMNFGKNSDLNNLTLPEYPLINQHEIWISFINGLYSDSFSYVKNLPENFYFGFFSKLNDKEKKNILDISNKGESGINGGFFSALNAACLEDILILIIPENSNFKQNINLVFGGCGSDNNFYMNQKLIIINSKNSKSNIIQYHVGDIKSKYFDNTTISIVLKEESKMKYTLINRIPDFSCQIASVHVDMQKNSYFEFSSASLGGFISRINLGIDINGINSNAIIKSVSFANLNNITDFHSRISHNYPECSSSQLHKNLVSEKGHAIFAGKIQVHSGSFNTKSEQLCKTLLLSPLSRVDTMPILEINNDNVKCTHGSTVSDLDKNQIFYFQSRGIPVEIARNLLTSGFIKDIIGNFPDGFENTFFKLSNLVRL